MYLKEIGLKGFKSFANKIKLNITPGITVIVGPNGCGKSNIIDAVRWILGEQNIRSLRGTKITDMIFSGNQEQKMRNFAQVYMLFNNAERKFSIDSEEVEIKRIIYRSGEIENYINNMPCKLKDIQELFLGSGLGKNSYSIIAQGRVDFVLNSKPSERRILFEEASDVAIYRNKKENALKKLDATENNLLRINDILYGVEETLSHYKKKSDDLETYKSYQDQILILEYYILSQQYKSLQRNISRNNKKLEIFKIEISEINKSIIYNKNQVSQIEKEKEQLEKQLDENSRQFQANEINKNNYINQLSITSQKKLEVQRYLQNIKEDTVRAQNQYTKFVDNLADIDNDIKETYQKEEYFVVHLKKEESLLEKYNKIYNFYREKLHNIETISNDIKSYYNDYREEKIKKNIEVKSINISLAEINREREHVIIKITNNQELIRNINLELSVLESEINQLKEEERRKDNELIEKGVLIEKENEIIQRYYNELNLKNKEIHLVEELITTIQNGNIERDDFFLELENSTDIISICELKNVIKEIPANLEQIFNFILDEGIKYLHLVHSDKIPFFKRLLKEKNSIKIKIIANNLVLPANNDLNIFKNRSGFENNRIIGFANELISPLPEYKKIIDAALGHILIVEDISTALNVAKQIRGQWIIISLDGIIINEKGIVTIGFTLKDITKDSHNISKKRILELRKEIQFIKNELQKKQLFLETEKQKYKELYNELQNISKQLKASIAQINEITVKLDEIKYNIKDSENALQTLIKKRDDELVKINNKEKEIIILNRNIINLENYLKYISIYNDCLFKYKDNCSRAINKVERDRNNLKMKLSWGKERAELLQKRQKEMEQFIISYHQEEKEQQEKLEHYNKEHIKLIRQEVELKENLDSIIKKQNKLNESINIIKDNLKEQESILRKIREEIELEQENLSSKKNALHECEMVYVQNQEKMNNLLQTIKNQYNTSLTGILRYKNYVNSQLEAIDTISKYKDQIKLMGQINFNALQEYQEQLVKFKELYSKKEEINKSKEKLIALIDEIDRIAEDHFYKTFQKVQVNFKEIFKKLFRGGEVSLELTNNKKLLEAGIEVLVQPPGKKVQNISLLSTGEKALTAIALLFALWKANPTPFCFFDEIDSALDETNAIRLASFIKNDDLKNSQIIIITHQREVMQAADALYGITMDGFGTSKLMSVKMMDLGEK